MTSISVFVEALAVVQQREKLNNPGIGAWRTRCKGEAIGMNSQPMAGAMHAANS